MIIIGIAVSLFFAVLLASGNVVYQEKRPKNRLWTAFAAFCATVVYVFIAIQQGWSLIYPEGKGLLLVAYFLAILLNAATALYPLLKKFSTVASCIFLTLLGEESGESKG